MSENWICITRTSQEKEQLIAALHQAGIPDGHVTVSRPEFLDNRDPGEGEAKESFWPLADGALSGCVGGAFGAYIGAISLFFPGIEPLHHLGPVTIIMASAAICAAVGMATSMAIKAWFPDHEKRLKAEAAQRILVTLTIHGDDRRESRLIHDVLMATGHGDSLHASVPG